MMPNITQHFKKSLTREHPFSKRGRRNSFLTDHRGLKRITGDAWHGDPKNTMYGGQVSGVSSMGTAWLIDRHTSIGNALMELFFTCKPTEDLS